MSSHLSKELSPPPPLLTAFETAAPRGRCFATAVVLGILWLGLGAGDWYMRFHHFGWHKNFVIRAAGQPPAESHAHALTNAPSRGGDLSRLIGIPSAASRYEEDRPAATNVFDASGFRVAQPIAEHYPVVVVGDSYAAAGPRDDDLFASCLASEIGQPVLNHAVEARGTFWSIVRFFASERFRGNEPRVLVWPVIEREIAGVYFLGGLYQVVTAETATNKAAARETRIDWLQLHPRTLKRSLPNTSAFSYKAGKVWNRARYEIFGQLNPAVVPSVRDVAGGPMLFYSEALATERWDDEIRDMKHLVESLAGLAKIARERGIEPVIVLVPDKERVYADALPPHIRAGVRPSVLPDVEAKVRAAGVRVVNLLPAFESAAGRGEILYWRDDTHWNPAGIRLAAQTAAPEVRTVLESHGAGQPGAGKFQ